MAWYDISGPDFWTLSYADNGPGSEVPAVGWNGTQAEMTFSSGYAEEFRWVNLVLTPSALVTDVAGSISQMRVTLLATFGASPGTTGNDGFLFTNTSSVGGLKIPDSGAWAQSGVSQIQAVVPDDVPASEFSSFADPLLFLAGDGVGFGFGGVVLEAVGRSLDITVVSIESDIPISAGGNQFWTNYVSTAEYDL